MTELCAVHLFGARVHVAGLKLLPEFDKFVFDCGTGGLNDVIDAIDERRYKDLPPGFPERAKGIQIFAGHDGDDYFGVAARMPQDVRITPEADIKSGVQALLTYLYGKDVAAQNAEYGEIFEVWVSE